jgi:hypothetical protein
MRRATALGLDVAEIERRHPRVMRDLARVCSLCDSRRACVHDLERNPGSPGWRDYCPNAHTFGAVADERPKSPTDR